MIISHRMAGVLVGLLAVATSCGGSSTDTAAPTGSGEAASAPTTARLVDVEDAAAIVENPPAGLVILDVRTPEEFAEGHIEGAELIDFSADDFADQLATLDRSVPYLVYCRSDNRSGQAVAVMSDLGFQDVTDVDGGIVAWIEHDLPVDDVTGPSDLPTDRPDPAAVWEARYGADDDYWYGTEPNDFLAATVGGLPIGDVLCLADGEGRNGVYLAGLGHRVTSVDLTASGMAKASRLAAERGVPLMTVVADLATFDLGEDRWDLIVSIFAHTPPPIRTRVHTALATALRPGGRLILEAYTPDQIGRGTGGPPVPELTMTLAGLQTELRGLAIEHGAELVRNVVEGPGHTGDGAVVQVLATRPA